MGNTESQLVISVVKQGFKWRQVLGCIQLGCWSRESIKKISKQPKLMLKQRVQKATFCKSTVGPIGQVDSIHTTHCRWRSRAGLAYVYSFMFIQLYVYMFIALAYVLVSSMWEGTLQVTQRETCTPSPKPLPDNLFACKICQDNGGTEPVRVDQCLV